MEQLDTKDHMDRVDQREIITKLAMETNQQPLLHIGTDKNFNFSE